jgi:drug/metabolite transporter (DMT)-like permease
VAAALALFTSVAYGVANYIGPRLARDAPILLLLTISQGASLVLAALVVAASGDAPPGAVALGWALLAGLGNASGLVFFYRAAEIGPLSIVTSVGSIGVGIPVAVGLAGGESVGTAQVAGMVLAISGLLLVSRRPPPAPAPVPGALTSGPDHVEAATDDHHARRRAIGLALLATIGFGLFLSALKPASEDGAAWAVFASRVSLVLVLVVMAAREGVLSHTPARKVALLTGPGVLLFAGTLSYAAATRRGDLSIVSVLSSLFTIVTVTLAVTLDHERLPRVAWAGVVAAIAGVVLLSAR